MSSVPRLDRIHEVLEMPLISLLTIVVNKQIGKGLPCVLAMHPALEEGRHAMPCSYENGPGKGAISESVPSQNQSTFFGLSLARSSGDVGLDTEDNASDFTMAVASHISTARLVHSSA
jgi:hypothetical protein